MEREMDACVFVCVQHHDCYSFTSKTYLSYLESAQLQDGGFFLSPLASNCLAYDAVSEDTHSK